MYIISYLCMIPMYNKKPERTHQYTEFYFSIKLVRTDTQVTSSDLMESDGRGLCPSLDRGCQSRFVRILYLSPGPTNRGGPTGPRYFSPLGSLCPKFDKVWYNDLISTSLPLWSGPRGPLV